MQQRQRLKNLDRFKANDRAILVSTDVAARGLDIPLVQHVVHYQIPRSSDIYIHRSGRTARAQQEGLSLALVSPEEVPSYKKICAVLNQPQGLPALEQPVSFMKAVKQRMTVVRRLDVLLNSARKEKSQKDWFARAAEECDMVLDDEFKKPNVDEEESGRRRKKNAGFANELLNHQAAEKREAAEVKRLKAELKHLLGKPLLPKSVPKNFITAGAEVMKERLKLISGEAVAKYKLSKKRVK
eukprot:TRINITY_DN5729_c0_g1_i4.p1 TRINITY_DN5729_c0_g1~~TRINITY_DN5729_c0_g1_i4.p1  ORF type:complete len:241 (-),score=84.27 TRINITY_DN5729_c0_g1_i4:42-764(-)